ncbi:hypothetical protein TNCV_3787851 [Trichonephila clavipes]|nr:hypothetical protein TNCV_3787851 [Trichonephila clavipes]
MEGKIVRCVPVVLWIACWTSNSKVVVDTEVVCAVLTPISGFKVHHTRGDKDQWPNTNPGGVQTADSASRVSLTFSQPGFQTGLYALTPALPQAPDNEHYNAFYCSSSKSRLP